jgi:hypothetical protein
MLKSFFIKSIFQDMTATQKKLIALCILERTKHFWSRAITNNKNKKEPHACGLDHTLKKEPIGPQINLKNLKTKIEALPLQSQNTMV